MSDDLIDFGGNGLRLQKDFMSGESWGSTGGFGMTISIGSTEKILDDEDRRAIRREYEKIEKIICGRIFNAKPSTLEAAAEDKMQILSAFEAPFHVKEIPNGYCSDYCHEKFPWFVVTTARGPITVGWRNRVVNLDWSGSDIVANGEELFAMENVTKGSKFIHCYGIESLRTHVKALMES